METGKIEFVPDQVNTFDVIRLASCIVQFKTKEMELAFAEVLHKASNPPMIFKADIKQPGVRSDE